MTMKRHGYDRVAIEIAVCDTALRLASAVAPEHRNPDWWADVNRRLDLRLELITQRQRMEK